MNKNNENKIALYIDADNISPQNGKKIIDILTKKGTIIIKEIIADWNGSVAKQWRNIAGEYSMTPIQQFAYVSGKNSSDMCISIHAMKDLFERTYIDTFCFVSSDSDFTRLAQEIKKYDKEVIGIGKKQSPKEFINAFTEFYFLDEDITNSLNENSTKENQCVLEPEKLEAFIKIVEELILENSSNNYALYSSIGTEAIKFQSDFHYKNYGFSCLNKFIEAILPFMKIFKKKQVSSDYALEYKK